MRNGYGGGGAHFRERVKRSGSKVLRRAEHTRELLVLGGYRFFTTKKAKFISMQKDLI